jgi:hypothetical protein
MEQGWAGRISAALIGSTVTAISVAIAVIGWYPDAHALNRLYAGIFIGVMCWMAMLFWYLFAPSAMHAWGRCISIMIVVMLWLCLPAPYQVMAG